MTFRTYNDALAHLPEDAAWSCSFGYPGNGGFNEYWRTPDGRVFVIDNGPWWMSSTFDWTITEK